jgi:hypothetical protein
MESSSSSSQARVGARTRQTARQAGISQAPRQPLVHPAVYDVVPFHVLDPIDFFDRFNAKFLLVN